MEPDVLYGVSNMKTERKDTTSGWRGTEVCYRSTAQQPPNTFTTNDTTQISMKISILKEGYYTIRMRQSPI